MPMLRAKGASHSSTGRNVRFVDGLLGTVTGPAVSRTVITYSRDPTGSGVSFFNFSRVHSRTVPVLATEKVLAPAYDVRDVVRRAREQSPGVIIGMRLDVEGEEYSLLDALSTAGEDGSTLLCQLSFLFVEHHNLHENMTWHGFPERMYNVVNDRIHYLMDHEPGCKLQINWRNFWSSCGDSARYVWMKSPQATGRNVSEAATRRAAVSRGRRRGRRRHS